MTVYGRGYTFVPMGKNAQSQPVAEPSHGPTTRTNLGREDNRFFGRKEESQILSELMEKGGSFITIVGPPGTGKTRLAKHWAAERLASGAVTSAWFSDLTEARSEEGVIQAVAAALDVALTTKKEGTQALADLVGNAIKGLDSTLVVIDNAEQVYQWVGPLLEGWWKQASQAQFVVTSQVALGVSMEQRMPLLPLPMPANEEGQAPCPAVQLFVDRARLVQPSFERTSDNEAAIAAIVIALDGLPLAIELAAARAHLMPPATLQGRLADRFRVLKRPKQAGQARHQTLQAALDWSWDLLEPWEQATLAQCSVFHGGFDWEAVEAVVDVSGWPEAPWSVDVVAELVGRSLVIVREDEGGMGRLSLLSSVTEYAREKLSQMVEPEVQGAQLRLAHHFAQFGSLAYIDSLSTSGGVDRLWRLRGDLGNLLTGIEAAIVAEKWGVASVDLSLHQPSPTPRPRDHGTGE
jgi:predicted ATPase